MDDEDFAVLRIDMPLPSFEFGGEGEVSIEHGVLA
jgi:hypothetical protein